MPRATVSTGMELEYETFGDPSHPALLLVMGFTAQLIAWDASFCRQLADGGRFVIRFDNRDCGLSTKLDGVPVDMNAVLTALMLNQPELVAGKVPYTLSDMAADAVGVLDALGITSAHIVGASMGGMIAQTIAIEHPHRTISLTSIMSMTGEPEYGAATPEAQATLLTPPPTDRQGYIDSSGSWQVYMSKRYRDLDEVKRRAAESYDRSFYPEGASRQLAAIVASGSRAEALARLDVPTLVIHGLDDQLITPSGGERTAAVIPGAKLMMMEDMGHDLPKPLWPVLVPAILAVG